MTPSEFDAVFDSFRHGAFRLEALPDYDVGGADAERMEAHRNGRPMPERSVRTSPWLARIAVSTVTAGKSWERVRVVDDPRTDYQDYELLAYQESQAAGERILIVPRVESGDWGADFWLFDWGSRPHAVLMDYAPDGRWIGARLDTDAAHVEKLVRIREHALAVAQPLNEYLAARA